MKILQTNRFSKSLKKISKQDKLFLDEVIKTIIKNPSIGEEKKGDLKGVFVYKFKIKNVLFLLSYRYSNELLELIMLGSHENYYRDLKNYLD